MSNKTKEIKVEPYRLYMLGGYPVFCESVDSDTAVIRKINNKGELGSGAT